MKKISSAAIHCLKEALTHAYWYKSDLRSFLTSSLSDASLLSRLNWYDYKRNIAGSLIGFMVRNEMEYQGDLLRLMSETAKISDFSHLLKLEDGEKKAAEAERAVVALRAQVSAHEEIAAAQQGVEKRREEAREKRLRRAEIQEQLENLTQEYFRLLSLSPQKRGFSLQKINVQPIRHLRP